MDEELQNASSGSEGLEVEENSIKLHEEARKVTMGLGDSPDSHSPEPLPIDEAVAPALPISVPNWRKVNALLSQFGFPPIPVHMGGNLTLLPDQNAVCEVLLRVLAELERRKPGPEMENLRVNQRLLAELNLVRGEKAAIEEDNEKLRQRLESERVHMQTRLKDAENQLKELDRQSKVFRNKLETAYQQTKQRDQTIAELQAQLAQSQRSNSLDIRSTSDREKAIFRRILGREPGQGSVPDAKVVNLIAICEENRVKSTPRTGRESPQRSDNEDRERELIAQLQRISQDKSKLESQRKILQDENLVLKQELQERPTARQLAGLQDQITASGSDKEASDMLRQTLSILDLRHARQLPSAVNKMQQVIRAIPSLESFIKAVKAEVVPEEDPKSQGNSMDEVIPTLRSWKNKLGYYEAMAAFRNQLCQMLNLEPSPSTADFDIVRFTQIRAIKSLHGGSKELQYFKSLFEVSSDEEVVKVMNQVFLFVHEMKALLQVRPSQFSREALGLDQGYPLATVIESIKLNLQR